MMLTDDEIVDLQCLTSFEQIGEPPDGCDPRRYLGPDYIRWADGIWLLTQQGRVRLSELRASVTSGRTGSPSTEPSPPWRPPLTH